MEVLFHPEDTVSLKSAIPLVPTIFLLPLPHRSLSPGGRGLMETSDLGPSTPMFVTLSLSAHHPAVCVSVLLASTAGENSSKCWLCRCVCFMKTH